VSGTIQILFDDLSLEPYYNSVDIVTWNRGSKDGGGQTVFQDFPFSSGGAIVRATQYSGLVCAPATCPVFTYGGSDATIVSNVVNVSMCLFEPDEEDIAPLQNVPTIWTTWKARDGMVVEAAGGKSPLIIRGNRALNNPPELNRFQGGRHFTVKPTGVLTLEYVTLSNGLHQSSGSVRNTGTATFRSVVWQGNRAATNDGGAVGAHGASGFASTTLFFGCLVAGNSAATGGGGIAAFGSSSSVVLVDTVLMNNTAGTFGEGLFIYYSARGTLIDSPGIKSMDISTNNGNPFDLNIGSLASSCTAVATDYCQKERNKTFCGASGGSVNKNQCVTVPAFDSNNVAYSYSFQGQHFSGKRLCCPYNWVKDGDGSACRGIDGNICYMYGNNLGNACPSPCGSVLEALNMESYTCNGANVSEVPGRQGKRMLFTSNHGCYQVLLQRGILLFLRY
jgi:hypothetical protein